MPRYVAFLRGVNVGGARSVKMEVLRGLFERLGFTNVSTFIASGNVIFETPLRDSELLEGQIEVELLGALQYEITPFVRTGSELGRIVAFPAFPESSVGPRDELGIIFLSTPPGARVRQRLETKRSEMEQFRAGGREIYWLRHRTADGMFYSTLLVEKVLDHPFTIRSLRTVQKIADKFFPRS
jgi:uncharacterized protein (DUF1697 family)